MRTRRAAALALVALWAGAFPPPVSAGDETKPAKAPQTIADYADLLDRTWRESGADAFRKVARGAPEADPFGMLGYLLRRTHERGFPPSADDRAMLAAYCAPDAGGAFAPGLAACLKGWLDAPAAAWEAEFRLVEARRSARAAGPKGDDAGLLARLRAIDLATADPAMSVEGPVVRHQIASLVRRSGRDAEALELAAPLRETGRARGWPWLETAALDVCADALWGLGRRDEALDARRDEAALRRTSGTSLGRGIANEWLARLAALAGRPDEAVEAGRAALDAYAHAGHPEYEVFVRLELAQSLASAGRFDESEAEARTARAEAARRGKTEWELLAAAHTAFLLWQQNRCGEAIALCEVELPRAPHAVLRRAHEALRIELARALAQAGLFDAALPHLADLLELTRDGKTVTERALVLQTLAVVETGRGNLAAARGHLEACVKLLEDAREFTRLARAAAFLSRACAEAGDAKAALAWAERAVALASERASDGLRVTALTVRGAARLLVAPGDRASAIGDLEAACALTAKSSSPHSVNRIAAELELAKGLAASGRAADALPHFRAAGERMLTPGAGLADGETVRFLERLRRIASGGTEAAWSVAQSAPQRADEAASAAWWFEEAARAQTLRRTLQSGRGVRDAIPAELLDAEREALATIVKARRDAADASAGPDAAKALAAARAELGAAYDRLRANDVKVARALASAPAPAASPPVSLADAQRRLGPDTGLVTYCLSAERAFALVVTDAAASLVALGRSAEIRESAQAWLELASTPDGPEAALAERLHALLLAPLESRLAGRTRLCVVPDGILACVPFDALLRRAEGRAERVIERYEVVCAPSATVLELLARDAAGRPAARGVVALGDPAYPEGRPPAAAPPAVAMTDALRASVGGLAPLPRSGDEARAVAELYPGEERTLLLREHATVREFLDAAAAAGAPRRVLHTACHAVIDGRYPGLSGLVLAGGEVLDVETLARTQLWADLAVLSACETAGGTHQRGEGMIGLTRGFLLAGVPRVVVSSWRVADDATAGLMRDFHERMAREGQSPAAALRAAKLARLRAGGAAAHPYRWAAFALWGLR